MKRGPSILVFVAAWMAAAGIANADCPLPTEPDSAIVEKLVRYSVPPLDCARLRKKFASLDANDPSPASNPTFTFLRSAVPWYWDFIRRDAACARDGDQGILHSTVHDAFREFTGFCAGDAHPENFAIQFNPAPAPPTFGINDPDDAGSAGPVLGDFVRFLVAAKIGNPTTDIGNLIDTYAGALAATGEPVPDSKEYRKLLKKGPKTDEDTLPEGAPLCPTGLATKFREAFVASAARGTIVAPSSRLDCVDVSSSKNSGGSGGLPRYEMRFVEGRGKSAKKSEILVQFKGTQTNATAFYSEAGSGVWGAVDRYRVACKFERGPNATKCPVTALDGKGNGYFMRTKTERAIKLEKIAGDELQPVLRDEAAALGALHRDHLTHPALAKPYAERVRSLRETLVLDAGKLVETVKLTTDSLKRVLADPGKFEAACAAAAAKPVAAPGGAPAPTDSKRIPSAANAH
jgi:hypothetical protein